MRNKKNLWVLVVLLMVGALIGGLTGELLSHNTYLSWLNLGGKKELFDFSLNPAIDFYVLKFGFNIALKVNVGSMIGMALGILIYFRK